MLRALPVAVKAAVHGPELTKTSFWKITSEMLELHQRVLSAVLKEEKALTDLSSAVSVGRASYILG